MCIYELHTPAMLRWDVCVCHMCVWQWCRISCLWSCRSTLSTQRLSRATDENAAAAEQCDVILSASVSCLKPPSPSSCMRLSRRLMETLHCLSLMSWLSSRSLLVNEQLSTAAAAMSSGSFLTPGSWLTVGPPTPPPPPDIRVNDVSVNKDGNGGQPSPESAKRQWRRSSWCPEQERKKEEKQEYQRSLAVAGRRWLFLLTIITRVTALFHSCAF